MSQVPQTGGRLSLFGASTCVLLDIPLPSGERQYLSASVDAGYPMHRITQGRRAVGESRSQERPEVANERDNNIGGIGFVAAMRRAGRM
jgi:hypothetical protein